jgi:hypothetical protein
MTLPNDIGPTLDRFGERSPITAISGVVWRSTQRSASSDDALYNGICPSSTPSVLRRSEVRVVGGHNFAHLHR